MLAKTTPQPFGSNSSVCLTAADGTLIVKGPSGKSVLQVELSEGLNFEASEARIGQRRYRIHISEINRGSGITSQTPDGTKTTHYNKRGL